MLLLDLMRPLFAILGSFRAVQVLIHSMVTTDYFPVVEIPLGSIRGSRMVSDNGRKFLSFRGVPYAKAPVNQLRFRDPEDVEPWSGTLDATEEGPECLQFDVSFAKIRGVEDCLKLNVYTHSANPADAKRPVMLFLFPGGFTEGSGNGETYLYGPRYFLNRDIVLVTINYRLGPLGFLSTEDEVAPGNYGLLDQSMAIRWVKDYIGYFGGDANLITLFGSSAGAASIEYHLLSPRSQVWFFIMLLGDVPSSIKLHPAVGFSTGVPYLFFSGFTLIWPVMFAPRVDTEREFPFLPKAPTDMLRNGEFKKVPTIIGLNQNEGAVFVAELLYLGGFRMRRFEKRLTSAIALSFGQQFEPDGQQKSLEAYQRYFGSLRYPSRNVQLLEKMISDSSFFVCVQESLRYHASHNPEVYAYYYTHRNTLTTPFLLGVPRSYVDLGVSYTDELQTLFEAPIFAKLLRKPADVRVTDIVLDYWTSFAISGSNSTWLTSTEDSVGYMDLKASPSFVNSSYPFTERMPYWREFFGY